MAAAPKPRIAIGALALSAVGLVSLALYEGYSDKAIIPTKGDVPTVGFGSTVHADGKPVKMGDTTTPPKALQTAHAHITKAEAALRASLPGVKLTQGEYDLYLDFVYQYGIGNWNGSTMRKQLQAGNYRAACDALLKWRFQAGRDCSLAKNWGAGGCKGVWTRQQERHARCIGELK